MKNNNRQSISLPNENGDVLLCEGDSREASCRDGKNRRSVKWVQRMVDINKDESEEDAINKNQLVKIIQYSG